MAINFPAWVTNATAVPAAYLVPAKKFLYAIAACEYARRLHNAGWKWVKGEALDATEQMLLAAAFPTLWPTPPTEAQLRTYLANVWEPRHNAAQETRALMRNALENFDLSWVNWNGLIENV
jgi:hypothetical protein